MAQLKEHAESENINLKNDFENLEKEFFEIQNIFESQKAEQDDDKKRFDDEISQAGFQIVTLILKRHMLVELWKSPQSKSNINVQCRRIGQPISDWNFHYLSH